MSEYTGTEGLDIQALAAQMLGAANEDNEVEYEEEDNTDSSSGHPAWQEILNQIPQEYQAAVIPTLQKWDAGVSRQFQKIHDSYAPYRDFENIDPDAIRDALGVYEALNDNPEATWEAIGRVYGLSPQQLSQAMSSDSDDEEDYDGLPASVRDRLSRVDMHEQVLSAVTEELLSRQAADKEAQEDAELDEYLEELRDEYGEFDEDFVLGLIASGIDGEEAVGQYQQLVENIADNLGGSNGGNSRTPSPQIMSGHGGIPNVGAVDPSRLSSRDTKDLVAEILRMTDHS